MGRGSSGSGGARGGGSSTAASGDAGGVSASVAGYADLVTPKGVSINHAGQIKLTQPKTAEQATKMLTVVQKAFSIAQQEQRATSKLGNDHRRVAAELRLRHTAQQLSRALKMSRKLNK